MKPTYDELLAKYERVKADYEKLRKDNEILTEIIREELPKLRETMNAHDERTNALEAQSRLLKDETEDIRSDFNAFLKKAAKKWSFIAKLTGRNAEHLHENMQALFKQTPPDSYEDTLLAVTAAMPDDMRDDMEKVTAAAQSIGRKEQARAGAAAKLRNDPVQAAKAEALKLWHDWQAGKTLHKSGAAFARFVCDRYPVIDSQATVERWARKWRAEKVEK